MGWMRADNVYHSPEKFGLAMVGEMDMAEPNYSFNMLVVWRDERGQFWVGHDSGCSCPAPFESIEDVNELDGPHDKGSLYARVDYLITDYLEDEYASYGRYAEAELRKSASDLLSNA